MQSLSELTRRLIEGRVEFVLIGGFAAVASGVTLVTRDVDICCRFSEANLMRIQKAFADLHPTHRSRPDLPLALTPEQCAGPSGCVLDQNPPPDGRVGIPKGDFDLEGLVRFGASRLPIAFSSFAAHDLLAFLQFPNVAAKLCSLPNFLPPLKLSLRAENQSQILAGGRQSDGLPHANAAGAAINTGAKAERNLRPRFQEPLRHPGAILEQCGGHRRP